MPPTMPSVELAEMRPPFCWVTVVTRGDAISSAIVTIDWVPKDEELGWEDALTGSDAIVTIDWIPKDDEFDCEDAGAVVTSVGGADELKTVLITDDGLVLELDVGPEEDSVATDITLTALGLMLESSSERGSGLFDPIEQL